MCSQLQVTRLGLLNSRVLHVPSNSMLLHSRSSYPVGLEKSDNLPGVERKAVCRPLEVPMVSEILFAWCLVQCEWVPKAGVNHVRSE